MQLFTAMSGSYPRIGDRPEEQGLRRAIAAVDKGEKKEADLRAAEDEAARLAIGDQLAAGIDVVSDGQVRWYDAVSHLARPLEGVEIAGLLRFFDTNTYYRQPVVKGEVRWRRPLLEAELAFAKAEAKGKPVKMVITGPYTLARLARDERSDGAGGAGGGGGGALERLVRDFAEALAPEVEDLAAGGAASIQIDEPAILLHPTDLPLLELGIRAIAAEAPPGTELVLATYFGEASPLSEALLELPVAALHLDLARDPRLLDKVAAAGSPKALSLGILDGRNTKLEAADEVLPRLERVLPKIAGGKAYLAPSCGLEYLPRDRARKKLRRLVEVKDELLGAKSGGRAKA